MKDAWRETLLNLELLCQYSATYRTQETERENQTLEQF
jgi:hypothetical protein